MLAERRPMIMPALDWPAALEVSSIHSVAGRLPPDRPPVTTPPFCAPHHTATKAAIVGGGSGIIRPARRHWRTVAACSWMRRRSFTSPGRRSGVYPHGLEAMERSPRDDSSRGRP